MLRRKHRWTLVIFTLALTVLGFGCAHVSTDKGGAAVVAMSEAFQHFKGEFENTDYFKKHKPRSVAVLPFQDLERKAFSIDLDSEDPASIVRRGMYNHVSSLPFKDLELYDTDQRLQNAGLLDTRDVEALIAETRAS